MVDTKVSALTAATPVGTDLLYLVDDPAGTPLSKRVTVDDVLAVSQGTFKNVLDADTSVTGDGSTNDTSAIGTMLSAGGAYYFPPATYKISGSGVACNQTADLIVVCAPGAKFVSDGSLSGNMFNFDTNVSLNARVRFRWSGGIFDIGASPNSTGVHRYETLGTLNETGGATQEIFSLRDGFWSQIHVSDYVMTSRTDAHEADWYTDYSGCSWLTAGGDTHLFVNDTGGGEVIIENGVHIASRDSAIYVAVDVTGAVTQIADTRISNCSFYHCTVGVSMKADGQNFDVSNLFGFNTTKLVTVEDGNGTIGPAHGVIRDSRAVQAWKAIELTESENITVRNVEVFDSGVLDDAGGTTETGWLTTFTTPFGFTIAGGTRCRIQNCSVVDESSAWDSGGGTAPRAVRLLSSTAVTSVDNRVENLYVDGLDSVQGEVTGGTVNIDRTVFAGIVYGNSMTSYASPTLVGASSYTDHVDVRTKHLTADFTSARTFDGTASDNTALSFSLRSGATYTVEGYIVPTMSGTPTDFMTIGFSAPTSTGYWTGRGLEKDDTSPAEGRITAQAWLWTETETELGARAAEVGHRIEGLITTTAAGDLILQAGVTSRTTDTLTLETGSWLRVTRIG